MTRGAVLPGKPSSQAVVIAAALLLCAALAWLVTARLSRSNEMSMSLEMMSMHPMSFSHAAAFLAMWVAMMTAMMLPVVTPTVMAHHMVRAKQGDGTVSTIVFVGGYLSVWLAIGVVPLAVFVALPRLVTALGITPVLVAGGALLIAGGLYQLTKWKEACLRHCRHPLDFLMTHDFTGSHASTYRGGVVHGAFCVGCCWAAMLVVIAMGMTNLILMALVAAFFVAERWSRWAQRLDRVVTPALVAAGAWVILAAI